MRKKSSGSGNYKIGKGRPPAIDALEAWPKRKSKRKTKGSKKLGNYF